MTTGFASEVGHAATPPAINALNVSFFIVTLPNSPPYFATSKSLTIRANTTPPHSFTCVRSPAARLYLSAAADPIALTYLVDALFKSIQWRLFASATAMVAAVSFARFSMTLPPLNVRRVKGVTRMGVAPASMASVAKVARLVL